MPAAVGPSLAQSQPLVPPQPQPHVHSMTEHFPPSSAKQPLPGSSKPAFSPEAGFSPFDSSASGFSDATRTPPTSVHSPTFDTGSGAFAHAGSATGAFFEVEGNSGTYQQVSKDGMDRFASVYIPQWLRYVNSSQPSQTILPDDGSRKQNILAYPEHIYPKSLLDAFDKAERQAEKAVSCSGPLEKLGVHDAKGAAAGAASSNEAPDTKYASKLVKLQVNEHSARKVELNSANLYNVPLTQYELPPAASTSTASTASNGTGPQHSVSPVKLYKLQVPALREGYPMLDVSDVVLLRQLRPELKAWQGIEFVASV